MVDLIGKVVVNMILFYLLGVLLVMLGEMIIEESCVVLDFFLMFCVIGVCYSGFEMDIYGVKCDDDGCCWVNIFDIK